MKKIATIISLLFIGILPSFAQIYVNGGDYDTNPVAAATCYNLSYNMRRGDKDSIVNGEVTKLQEALSVLGYMYQDPTGTFGNATFSAVKNFQSANGLSSTGYVGNLTRAAIQSKTCGTVYNNNPSNTVCATYTTYTSSSCVCPSGYYAMYTIPGSSAFSCQNGTGNNNGNNNGVISCNLNTVYTTNSCVCPSGYTAATYGAGTFMCQSYNGYNNNYNNNNYTDCNYYGTCNYNNGNNQYNNICAVGENVTVDLSRCTCPTGYTAVQYQTYAYNGTQTGMCRYQGWYGY